MIIAVLTAIPVYLVFAKHQGARWRIIFAEAVFIAIPFVLLFYRIGAVEDTTRDGLNAVTLQSILHFLPFGSGLGSFIHVYPMFDQASAIGSSFVNHAHNDWFELTLELGVAFPVIAVLLLTVLIRSNWRDGLSGLAILILFALSLHSLVDYPLRTMGIGIVFAYALGITVCKTDYLLIKN